MNHDAHDLSFADERVTAYLDGELDAAELARFEADLERDPSLQAELDALVQVQVTLREHLPMKAPADFLDDVLAAAAEEGVVQLAWYRRPFGIPLEGLAVAAAALLVVYVALPGRAPVADAPTEVAAARAVSSSVRPYAAEEAAGAAAKSVDQAASMANDLPSWEKTDELEKARRAVESGALPEEQAKGEALFVQVPYSYRVVTRDPAVLARLSALAEGYSGELKGGELQLDELSRERDAASVTVRLPSSVLRDFGRSLEALGAVEAIEDNSMFAGDPVEVRVQVQLEAAPEKKVAPSRAGKALPKGVLPKKGTVPTP